MTKQDKAAAFCKLARQYNAFSVSSGTVEKTFNRGNGSLALYRFGNSNRVTVNVLLERHGDRKRLLEFMPDVQIILGKLGYPDWYSSSLSCPDKH